MKRIELILLISSLVICLLLSLVGWVILGNRLKQASFYQGICERRGGIWDEFGYTQKECNNEYKIFCCYLPKEK